MNNRVIIVRSLRKKFNNFRKKVSVLARVKFLFNGNVKKRLDVLNGISFELGKSEILGVIGKNGSGKSTLLRILAGIYPNYSGSIKINGNVIPLLGFGEGIHDRLTMRDNIFLLGSLFGCEKVYIKNKFDSVVEFAGLKDFVETKLYKFSSGMKQRLAFSVAIHCNPDVLLLDEIFAVGDEDFRKKSSRKIKELARNGTSIVFVSHELWMIEEFCDRVIWIDFGKVKMEGKPSKVIREYRSFKD